MGLFKQAVRYTLGPQSRSSRLVLDAAHQLRRQWKDPFLQAPVPLLDPDRSLMILWSAKSACSLTFVWYLSILEQLDDYLASGVSPHEYRGRYYLRSDAFTRGRARMVVDDYRIVHVIRDPYQRAIPSYRHMLATGLADTRLTAFEGAGLTAPPASRSCATWIS